MPTRIVTSAYRYKKAVPLEGPAIVRSGQASKPATPAPANDDRKPAIVTAAKRGRRRTEARSGDRPRRRSTGEGIPRPHDGLSAAWDWYATHSDKVNPIVAGLGGAALVWAAIRQARTATNRHYEQTRADQQRRLTESFSKAVEQLASDKIEARLGGIYTLERLAIEAIAQVRSSPWWRRLLLRLLRRNDTPPADPVSDLYWTVMETLTAFVRERAKWQEPNGAQPEMAAQSESVAGRHRNPIGARQPHAGNGHRGGAGGHPAPPEAGREREQQRDWRFDLRDDGPPRRHLHGAHLEGAILSEAHLERANLSEAHLEGADLSGAHLEGADLSEAHLEGADLRAISERISKAPTSAGRISKAPTSARRWRRRNPATGGGQAAGATGRHMSQIEPAPEGGFHRPQSAAQFRCRSAGRTPYVCRRGGSFAAAIHPQAPRRWPQKIARRLSVGDPNYEEVRYMVAFLRAALPQTYAPWPVWSDSTTQTVRFQPMPKKAAVRLWHRARDFDRGSSARPVHRSRHLATPAVTRGLQRSRRTPIRP